MVKAARLVVDGRVKTEFAREPRALLGAARRSDDATAGDFCQLAGDRANCTRGARDENGFARARTADIEQAESAVRPVMPRTPMMCSGLCLRSCLVN